MANNGQTHSDKSKRLIQTKNIHTSALLRHIKNDAMIVHIRCLFNYVHLLHINVLIHNTDN